MDTLRSSWFNIQDCWPPILQVLLPLLKSDLYDIMRACHDGTLASQEVLFDTELSAVAVVSVSGGYPVKYAKGLPITGRLTASKLL